MIKRYGWTKPLPGTPINQQSPYTTGLEAMWLMNEGGHNTLGQPYGRTKYGRSSAFAGQLRWSPSHMGVGLWGDGTDDGVVVGSGDSQFALTSFTIISWAEVRLSTFAVLGGGVLTQRRDGTYWWVLNWITQMSDAGIPSFTCIKTGGSTVVTCAGPTSIADGRLHMVAGTLNGVTGAMALYVDGALVDTDTIAGAPWTGGGTGMFTGIGNSVDAWPGIMETVSIYNRVLTEQEIRTLYVSPFIMFERPRIELIEAATSADTEEMEDISSFPSDLLYIPERYDYPQGVLVDPTLRGQSQEGRPLFRSGYQPIHRTWAFDLRHLTVAQKEELEAFQETVGVGVEPFYWTDTRPVSGSGSGGGSGGTYTVQLTMPIIFDLDDDGVSYRVSVVLSEYCG